MKGILELREFKQFNPKNAIFLFTNIKTQRLPKKYPKCALLNLRERDREGERERKKEKE